MIIPAADFFSAVAVGAVMDAFVFGRKSTARLAGVAGG
jgi:hypothetical protein